MRKNESDLEKLRDSYIADPTEEHKSSLWVAMYRYCLRREYDPDLSAEAAAKAIASIHSQKSTEHKLRSWLYRIYTNLALNQVTRDREHATESRELEALQLAMPSAGIKITLGEVRDPVNRMLCEDILGGYSLPEAASRVGISANAAQKRLKSLGRKISRDRLIL